MENQGGVLFGRGTTDDKGPAMAWLWAIEAILESAAAASGDSSPAAAAAAEGEELSFLSSHATGDGEAAQRYAALAASGTVLPVNLIFCIECMEESGSEG
jgi:acetylornithine deacetylase/succinyl-diaminopimelate desuccinylase-like protein